MITYRRVVLMPNWLNCAVVFIDRGMMAVNGSEHVLGLIKRMEKNATNTPYNSTVDNDRDHSEQHYHELTIHYH